MSKKRKSEFYSLKKILAKEAQYNVIFGQRSNGKTYSCLEYALTQYIDTGNQSAYLRRWDMDIRKNQMDELFSGIVANGTIESLTKGQYNGVYYFSKRMYLCHFNEEGKRDETDPKSFMYIFALSLWQHDKSISYPFITTIIFDEFITKDYYLTDEFVIFANVISTIVRKRTNVKIFMLGNTINKYCPYFKEMGLRHIKSMKQDTIDVYSYGNSGLKVAVEYCEHIMSSTGSDVYFAFDNPKLQMITNGVWEIDMYPHCPEKYAPKDVVFTFFILFDESLLQCEVVQLPNNIFIFIHLKTSDLKYPDRDLIYTVEYSSKLNYRRNILRPMSECENKIATLIKAEKIFYQDNDVGEIFRNYLQFCSHNK